MHKIGLCIDEGLLPLSRAPSTELGSYPIVTLLPLSWAFDQYGVVKLWPKKHIHFDHHIHDMISKYYYLYIDFDTIYKMLNHDIYTL